MITLNTAKCGTQKQQDEIIVLIGILHLLRPNSAPRHIKLYKAIEKLIDHNVQEGIRKKDYECGTIS
jgi:hypothetical protein